VNDSVSFDDAVEFYDRTRGGLSVGRNIADVMNAHLAPASRVLELGVGTGLIALPLTELGHAVLGIDLSPKMISRARDRIGARVAVADATRVPIASASCDAIVASRILHVVGDPVAALAEAARIVRVGGQLLVVPAGGGRFDGQEQPDDIGEIARAMRIGRAARGPTPDEAIALADAGGFDLVARERTAPEEYGETPREHAARIEQRTWSGLWGVDDETWARSVQPTIDRLLALPDPDRPRSRRRSHRVLVFARR
jgi:SAM-dependent methyltransferase